MIFWGNVAAEHINAQKDCAMGLGHTEWNYVLFWQSEQIKNIVQLSMRCFQVSCKIYPM